MKIAYISGSSIPSRTANSIHVMKMCQAMTQEVHQITLYAPKTASTKPRVDEELWHHYGVAERFPVEWLGGLRWLRGYDYALNAVREARRSSFDLIYTRQLQAAVVSAWVGVPAILELHTLPTGRIAPHLFKYFLSLKNARRRLVVISAALRRLLIESFPSLQEKIEVLIAHDGIDLERFTNLPSSSTARQQLRLPDVFTVVYAGHLYPGRGIELLLDLADRLPSIQFVFVGGEPKSVQARCEEVMQRGLLNARFVGFIPNSELPGYLAAGDVFVMPHQRRVAVSGSPHGDISGFMSPLKMFEYLAAGRAIVTSDLPVLREVLDESMAVFCSPEDRSQWQDALVRLSTDTKWRSDLASKARQEVQEYSWRRRVNRCLSDFL